MNNSANIGRFLATVLVTGLAVQAQAFQLAPIEMELEPKGTRSQATFILENNDSVPAAIEIKMYARGLKEDGTETRSLTEDFFFFPKQVRLEPKQQRALKVSWKGPAQPTKELAYRLIAEQLPVEFVRRDDNAKPNIRFLMKFVASLYVAPPRVAPSIRVESAGLRKGAKGDELVLVLANAGTKHRVLKNLKLHVPDGKGKSVRIEMSDATRRMFDNLNLLAESKVRVAIPAPAGLVKAPEHVDVHFD